MRAEAEAACGIWAQRRDLRRQPGDSAWTLLARWLQKGGLSQDLCWNCWSRLLSNLDCTPGTLCAQKPSHCHWNSHDQKTHT